MAKAHRKPKPKDAFSPGAVVGGGITPYLFPGGKGKGSDGSTSGGGGGKEGGVEIYDGSPNPGSPLVTVKSGGVRLRGVAGVSLSGTPPLLRGRPSSSPHPPPFLRYW